MIKAKLGLRKEPALFIASAHGVVDTKGWRGQQVYRWGPFGGYCRLLFQVFSPQSPPSGQVDKFGFQFFKITHFSGQDKRRKDVWGRGKILKRPPPLSAFVAKLVVVRFGIWGPRTTVLDPRLHKTQTSQPYLSDRKLLMHE